MSNSISQNQPETMEMADLVGGAGGHRIPVKVPTEAPMPSVAKSDSVPEISNLTRQKDKCQSSEFQSTTTESNRQSDTSTDIDNVAAVDEPVANNPTLWFPITADVRRAFKNLIRNTDGKIRDKINIKDKAGMTPLHFAARHGAGKVVDIFVKNGADIKACDNDGSTPLHYAACFKIPTVEEQKKLPSVIEYLANAGADMNVRNSLGQTPLHFAARLGNEAAFKQLLTYQNSAQIEASDVHSMTPLHMASYNNHSLIVRMLIDSGANLRPKDRFGYTPLHAACMKGHINIVEMLLQAGARKGDNLLQSMVTDTDKRGTTCLIYALANGHADVAKACIENEADVNACYCNLTPLHIAVAHNDMDLVRFLVDREDIIIDNINTDLVTPLHIACRYNHVDLVEFLVSSGADTEWRDMNNYTPLLRASTNGHKETIALLINMGVDVKKELLLATEENKLSALEGLLKNSSAAVRTIKQWMMFENSPQHIAAMKGYLPIIRCLFKYGADLTLFGEDEKTPLHLAATFGRIDVTRQIVVLDTDSVYLMDKNKDSPLHLAAQAGHAKLTEFLIKANSYVGMRNMRSWTPLDCAADNGWFETAKVLLEAESPRIPDGDEDTTTTPPPSPLHLAAKNGHTEVVKLFIDGIDDVKYRNHDGYNCLDIAIENNRTSTALTIVKSEHWQESLRNYTMAKIPFSTSDCCYDTPMRKLIRKMPDVAKEVFNRCMTENSMDFDSDNYQITYTFEFLDDFYYMLSWKKSKSLVLEEAASGERDIPQQGLTPGGDGAVTDAGEGVGPLVTGEGGADRPLLAGHRRHRSDGQEEAASGERDIPQQGLTPGGDGAVTDAGEGVGPLVTGEGGADRPLLAGHRRHRSDGQGEAASGERDIPQQGLTPGGEGAVADACEGSCFCLQICKGLPCCKDKLTGQSGSYTNDSNTFKKNHPLNIMVTSKREDLLSHPLVTALLTRKWKCFVRHFYYVNFAIYLVYLGFLTAYIFTTDTPYKKSTCIRSCEDAERAGKEKTLFAKIGMCAIFTLVAWNMALEVIQICMTKLSYICCENVIELITYVTSVLLVIDWDTCQKHTGYRTGWQWNLGIVAMFLAWINLVMFVQKLSSVLGIFVVMFTNVLKNFMKLFIVLFLYTNAFALAFHALIHEQESFSSYWEALIKTTSMMTGEGAFELIFHEDDDEEDDERKRVYPKVLSYIMICVFMVVMSIIVMNLLVGLAVDTIKEVQEQAELTRKAMKVDLTLDVEKLIPIRVHRRFAVRTEKVKPNTRCLPKCIIKVFSQIFGFEGIGLEAQNIRKALHPESNELEKIEELQNSVGEMYREVKVNNLDGQEKLQNTIKEMDKEIKANNLRGQESQEKLQNTINDMDKEMKAKINNLVGMVKESREKLQNTIKEMDEEIKANSYRGQESQEKLQNTINDMDKEMKAKINNLEEIVKKSQEKLQNTVKKMEGMMKTLVTAQDDQEAK